MAFLRRNILDFYFSGYLDANARRGSARPRVHQPSTFKDSKGLLLAEGTLFSAGVDSNKQPIQFETLKGVLGSWVHYKCPTPLAHPTLVIQMGYRPCFKQVANPSKIPDSSAKTLPSWSPFGASNDPDAVRESLGFAFASPYLFLPGRTAHRYSYFYFQGQTDLSFLDGAQMYLSSSGGWVSITEFLQDPPFFQRLRPIRLPHFFLDARFLYCTPLERQRKACKVIGLFLRWFLAIYPNRFPTDFIKVTIETDVDAIKNFQLYNDFGFLSTKVPFELFGPTPSNQANFIMGSQEIFSKISVPKNWILHGINFQPTSKTTTKPIIITYRTLMTIRTNL